MKICIPTQTDNGIEADVHNHFGSANYFTIYNTDDKTIEVVANENLHHAHGACKPATSIGGKDVKAIICGGMGKRAVMMLNNDGIKVYLANKPTVKETVAQIDLNQLTELTTENACNHHGCSH